MTVVELRAGELRLAVRPDLGGAVAGLWLGALPVMRSTAPAELASARAGACYPLVPYSNRIGHRNFSWAGQRYSTAANFDDNPHSVHGVAWLRPWEVLDVSADTLALRYVHTADAHWPFAFEVTQTFQVTPHSLRMGLDILNVDSCPQPVGLGWHPYFPKRAGSHLRIQVGRRWLSDAQGLPTEPEVVGQIDRAVAELDLDHCFDGWEGAANVRDAQVALSIQSSVDRLVIYTPQHKPYFCVEPVSHLSNAINQVDPVGAGLRELLPGARYAANMVMEIQAS